MRFSSTYFRYVAPLAVAALVGCQTTQPTSVQPETEPTAMTHAIPTAQPVSAERVQIEPIKDQLVLVNQVGYLPAYRKIALVADANATTFQVVDSKAGMNLFTGSLGDPIRDPDTGNVLRSADFSNITQPGTYSVQVPGVGRSPEFRVAEDVYSHLYTDVMNSYSVLAAYAPQTWHTASATDRKTGQVMDVSGGWPDAGDYGRYVPSAASALGTMLLLDDIFPGYATQPQLQILRSELDWMLKMQRSDGAVYHKVTPMNFGGFDKNSDNIGGQLYVFDVSTPDAGVFAAVMAEAARIYQASDVVYSARLLHAAEQSWAWLQDNPKPILPADKEGTGGYVYSRDGSQRLWAAAELYKTTGKDTYSNYAFAYFDRHQPTIGTLGWDDPETYAVLSLASNGNIDPRHHESFVQMLRRWAEGMVTTVNSPIDPWQISIASFHWASNKTTLDNAVLLLVANALTPDTRFVEAALDQLHYVLGRNAVATCFVTGYGSHSVKNPHNRTMFGSGQLVPGVMVGGPNGDGQDGITPPSQGQRSYVDQLQAYASNENSIEYNAPLAFVTAVLSNGSGG